jgi:hypothetical protein
MFKPIRHIILGALLSVSAALTWAQAVTVVEYYNKPLDAYFITGRVAEQTALDAQASFERTGMTFQAVAASGAPASATRVCRFYISTATPFSSTHFYGREGVDCEQIRALNVAGFAWEDYDFALAQPVGGSCAPGTTTIYRSFRAAIGGKTANHRYSASPESYIAMSNSDYKGEQDAFCTTKATDVTTPFATTCGTLYYQRVRVGYESRTDGGVVTNFERFHSGDTIAFNGVSAVPIVERTSGAQTNTLLIQETAINWTEVGTSTLAPTGATEFVYTPPTSYPKRMAAGQRIDFTRRADLSPAQSTGSSTQVGAFTHVGREAVTVPLGAFDACKFSSELTTTYATGRIDVSRSTIWVAAYVGIVKSSTKTSSTVGTTTTSVTTEVSAITQRPL